MGSFTVEGSSSLLQSLTFRGQSDATTQLLITSRQYDVDIIVNDLTLSIIAAGLPGQNGANGLNDDDPNGQPGEPGGNGRNVNVNGRCWVRDVDISGGNGGNGGNGTSFANSVGANGGGGGNKGSLTLQVDKLIGAVTASQGLGGGGGTGQLTNGTAGTDGSAAAATLTFDLCDIRQATLAQPEVILSRCLYLTSQSLSVTDDGGNAVK